ncbi:MAG: TonB-dependent receptor [Phenylobacterium sp.]|uniref:TonB-dependent receptor n=2 Tax=Phenylobacterium sp. TaxID=1871053 RepID=UPI001811DFE2|nr:TonB-dependent receptor [Phenylobacterium sp.]MBA4794811.1 TonB-dependent receptor [Phenylobacterium sp.]
MASRKAALLGFAGVSLSVMSWALAASAGAQEAKPAGEATAAHEVEALVVTAQRREQAIEEVPVAITAFGPQAIESFGIQGHNELAYLTPGLIVQEQSPQRTGYVMRGITAEVTDAFAEPQISIYADGIDGSRQSGSIVEFVDLERVEVVKGPQGTLFGRGAAIGAISIRSARPNLNEAFGEAVVERGDYNFTNATAWANAPLVEGVLGVRGAVRIKRREGIVDNLAGPVSQMMARDTQFGRVAFRYEPTADWTTDLILQGQQDDPGPTEFKSISIPPAGGDVSPFTPTAQDRPDQKLNRRVFSAVLDSTYRLSPEWTLQSLSGYREIDALEQWDGDGTAVAYIIGDQDTQQWQVSQELRLSWQPAGPVSVFFGASAFHEEIEDHLAIGLNEQYLLNGGRLTAPPVTMFPAAPGVLLPVTSMTLTGRVQQNERDSLAVFADVSWRVNDRLTLEGGLRYQSDHGVSRAATTVTTLDGRAPIALRNGAFGGNSKGVFFEEDGGFDLLTPRIVALYRLNESVNLYAGIARGARSGSIGVGFTAAGVGVRDVVKPEYVNNYEVGLKARALDRMVLDAALYHFEYTDFITVDPDPAIGRINAGEASATGFETSLNGELTDNFLVSVGYAYHDGQYDNFRTSAGDLSGNRLRLAPKHTFSAAGDYRWPLANGMTLRLQGTVAYRGQHYFNDDNLPAEQQEAYTLVNGAFGVSGPGDRWYAEVWGNNIFDEEFVIDIGNTGKSFGGLSTAIRGEPGFYGVRLGARF